jgi:hypothetical protein
VAVILCENLIYENKNEKAKQLKDCDAKL